MRSGFLTLGAILLVVGLVWMGQGANLIGGSFMTGQPRWLIIGAITAILGIAIVWWTARR